MSKHHSIAEVRNDLRECSASLHQIGHEANNLGQDEYAEDVAKFRDEISKIEQELDNLHSNSSRS